MRLFEIPPNVPRRHVLSLAADLHLGIDSPPPVVNAVFRFPLLLRPFGRPPWNGFSSQVQSPAIRLNGLAHGPQVGLTPSHF